MTLYLHFGVVDVPYVEREPPEKRNKRIAKNAKHPRVKPTHADAHEKTTGDVATILEDKYGLMNGFYENKEVEIVGFLEESLSGALENIIVGGPTDGDPFAGGTELIEESFKDFISSYEAEHIGIEGTPTKAALRGVNHRLKHPYAKANPRRPSFDDTGLLQSSFKAWVEDK